MSSDKRLVTLHGGHSDGEIIAVEPTRLQIVQTYDRGERFYAEGEWGFGDSPPVVTRLVEFELYERVDADTFKAVAA